MHRIRFHGRGGQGMKTASRILGSAFFLEGFEVQDAPRYGAERRGAPIFAYVRASKKPVYERGIIDNPDLIIVADDSLVPIPVANVLAGVKPWSTILINSSESSDTWRKRLNVSCNIISLPIIDNNGDNGSLVRQYIGVACAGAGAKLLGAISAATLEQAIKQELSRLGDNIVSENIDKALTSYEMAAKETDVIVAEGEEISAVNYNKPDWIELPFEKARFSAPIIHAGLTSSKVKTGLWRTMRPVIDHEHCNHCWWLCGCFCPDGAINIKDNSPQIDYDHCKGCMICLAQCPPHAIQAVSESEALKNESGGACDDT